MWMCTEAPAPQVPAQGQLSAQCPGCRGQALAELWDGESSDQGQALVPRLVPLCCEGAVPRPGQKGLEVEVACGRAGFLAWRGRC